jgi:hypothetical protein
MAFREAQLMSATKASALVTAHALHRLLVELSERPEDDATGAFECARDYMEDVIAVLNESTPFPARSPSPNLDGKRGGAPEVLVCERALAQIGRTKQFLENHFAETRDEPPGWCPIETCYYLGDALGMLEPLDEGEDTEPPPGRRVS